MKKPNFFKKLAYSFVPGKYNKIAAKKTGTTFFVVLFTAIIYILGIMGQWIFSMNKLAREIYDEPDYKAYILSQIPDFSIRNGELTVDEPVYFRNKQVMIIVDPEVEVASYLDIEFIKESYPDIVSVIFASKTNILIYNGKTEQLRNDKFKNLTDSFEKNKAITKDWVIQELSPYAKKFSYFFVGIFIIFGLLSHYFVAFFYALAGFIIDLVRGKRMKFGEIYRGSVYALVPYYILSVPLIFLVGLTIYIDIKFILELLALIYVAIVVILYRKDTSGQNNPFENNPYTGAYMDPNINISDSSFSGYASIEGGSSNNVYKSNNGSSTYSSYSKETVDDMVDIKGHKFKKEDMDLIDRYVQGNLKEMAINQLEEISGLSLVECTDIVYNWYQYYVI